MFQQTGHVVECRGRNTSGGQTLIQICRRVQTRQRAHQFVHLATVFDAHDVGAVTRMIDQILSLEHVHHQRSPSTIVLDADQDFAVGRGIRIVGNNRGMAETDTWNLLVRIHFHVHRMAQPLDGGIEHRDLDERSLARSLSTEQALRIEVSAYIPAAMSETGMPVLVAVSGVPVTEIIPVSAWTNMS